MTTVWPSRSRHLWRSLWQDQQGLVLSAELIIIVTLVVIGLITGLACLQQAVVGELQDVGFAIRGMNQSYGTPTFWGCRKFFGPTSYTIGSRFTDYSFIGGATIGAPQAEIGSYSQGKFIDLAPSTGAVTGGCTTCGPTTTPPPPTRLTPCPEGTPCPDAAPSPPAAPCKDCTPNGTPNGLAPAPVPQPEIPQGPAPQILPQQS